MSNNKISPEAKGTWITCLVIAEVLGFVIIKPIGVVGAGLVGGGAAMVALFVAKQLVESKGTDFYQTSNPQKSPASRSSHAHDDNQLESWEAIKNDKRR